jgi:hypothetical protein
MALYLGCGTATVVACTSDAEVLEGMLGALDSHEFEFAIDDVGRCIGLYVGLVFPSLSSLLPHPSFDLELTRFDSIPLLLLCFLRGHTKG